MPAHLIAEEGPHRGLVLNLEQGDEWVIGRDPEVATFVVEDTTVSRKHARLTRTAEGIFLSNLSRVNTTLVNGEELSSDVLLKEGDHVQIGNTVFLFSEEAIPDVGYSPVQPAKKKPKNNYDDIFGELDEPETEAIIPTEEKKEELP